MQYSIHKNKKKLWVCGENNNYIASSFYIFDGSDKYLLMLNEFVKKKKHAFITILIQFIRINHDQYFITYTTNIITKKLAKKNQGGYSTKKTKPFTHTNLIKLLNIS